jgi:dienelactone hydrolase
MMMLHVALRRKEPYAGLVGFSGRLLMPETLAGEIRSRPPVLLVHGDEDPMVPVASLKEAADALTAAGVETYTHVSRGVGARDRARRARPRAPSSARGSGSAEARHLGGLWRRHQLQAVFSAFRLRMTPARSLHRSCTLPASPAAPCP